MAETSVAPKAVARFDAAKLLGRVMIADDNLNQVDTTAALLRLEGYEVLGLPSGTAVLEHFEGFRPDVVILDIGMPEMSGYDTARALRAHKEGSQVLLIALTCYGSYSDELAAKMSGFDYHLAKPADPAYLTAIIRDYFSGTRPIRVHVIPDMPRR
jgi:DNA-binding response OmpR family regulator